MRFGDQPNEVSDYDGGGVLCLESEHGEDAGAFILVLEVIGKGGATSLPFIPRVCFSRTLSRHRVSILLKYSQELIYDLI